MARARRTLDRKTLREQGEVAERRKKDDVEEKEDEEEEEEDDDEEAEEGGDEAASDEGGDDDGDDEDEKPKKKKKAPAPKKKAAKAPTKPRTRAAKVVRMKLMWVVYSNSHSELERFPYPKRKEAEAYLEKVTNDKKSGGPFFLQPLKVPMDKE